MRFPCSTPFFLSVLSVGLVSAQDAAQDAASSTKGTDSVRLLQRIFHPSRPSEPFVDRGDILFSYPTTQAASHAPIHAGFVPSSEGSLQSYVIAFAEQLQTEQEGDLGPVDIESALYQLALAHPEHKHSTQWHVSSVKACHLPHATSESFTVHLSASGEPFALDYFVGPVPHDGSCPGSKKARRKTMAELGSRISNSSVLLKSPTYPPLPQLRTPPPLTPEGKPVTPPQEKSFIQKYWMYFALAFVALAMSGGPAEEEGQQGGGQGK